MKIRPEEGDVYFDVVAVVDPVTREAQRLAPLLTVRRLVCGLDVFVLLRCLICCFIVSYSKHAFNMSEPGGVYFQQYEPLS